MFAQPKPIAKKPGKMSHAEDETITSKKPAMAMTEPKNTTRRAPRRLTIASPKSRMRSIAAEKTAKPVPARDMSIARTSVRNTPDQSMTAPSTRKDIPATAATKATMPCGTASALPSGALLPASKNRAKASTKSTMMPAEHAVAPKGVNPSAIQTPKSPAPMKPPTLQSACMPLITRLFKSCSTRTAWILIVTSIIPMEEPNKRSVGTARTILSTMARATRSAAKTSESTAITRRQPKCPARTPAKGIVTSEPTPMQRSKSPSTSSATPSRAFKSGTRGAQDATPKPPTKKKA